MKAEEYFKSKEKELIDAVGFDTFRQEKVYFVYEIMGMLKEYASLMCKDKLKSFVDYCKKNAPNEFCHAMSYNDVDKFLKSSPIKENKSDVCDKFILNNSDTVVICANCGLTKAEHNLDVSGNTDFNFHLNQ